MNEFIGVIDDIDFASYSMDSNLLSSVSLKREALIFQKIAIPVYCNFVEKVKDLAKFENGLINHTELKWLLDRGVVIAPESIIESAKIDSKLHEHDEYQKYSTRENELRDKLKKLHSRSETLRLIGGEDPESERKYFEEENAKINKEFKPLSEAARDYSKRKLAIALRECNLDAVPILSSLAPPPLENTIGKSDLIQIVLNKLPIPDELTPWEQIIEFRDDPDSRRKFLALRNWISEIACMKLTHNEVLDKLESLLNEYQNHMRLHKIKTRLETLKTIVVAEAGFIAGSWLTGLGALPGLAGMVATPLYTIKQRQIALLEAEQKAPGKEIAYISKARVTFDE